MVGDGRGRLPAQEGGKPEFHQGQDAEASGWRLEELRRLTRATENALAELAAAGLIAIDEVERRADPLAGRRITPTAPLPLTLAQSDALDAILATLPKPKGGNLLEIGAALAAEFADLLQDLIVHGSASPGRH